MSDADRRYSKLRIGLIGWSGFFTIWSAVFAGVNEQWRWWFIACAGVNALLLAFNIQLYRRIRHGIRQSADAGADVPATGSSFSGYSRSAITGTWATSPVSLLYPYQAAIYGGTPTPPRACPRVAEPVKDFAIGFRDWLMLGTALTAQNVSFGTWQPGWNRAVCVHSFHTAPETTCECGFYARPHVSQNSCALRGYNVQLSGAVQAKGRIVEHGYEGFRAEEARVLALALPECHWHSDGEAWRWEHPLELAREYANCIGMMHSMGVSPPDIYGAAAQPCPLLPLARAMAERYAVPLIPHNQIEAYAYEFGQRMCLP